MADDSILPLPLMQGDCPTDTETRALEHLYQSAAQEQWVLNIGDMPDVPQSTDIATAVQHANNDSWTRGLLVQVCLTRVVIIDERRFKHHTCMSLLATCR